MVGLRTPESAAFVGLCQRAQLDSAVDNLQGKWLQTLEFSGIGEKWYRHDSNHGSGNLPRQVGRGSEQCLEQRCTTSGRRWKPSWS